VTSFSSGPAISGPLETGQHADRVDADLVDRIAALHDEQRRQAEPGDARADLRIVLALELELADRVLLERIDAERDDDDVRARRRELRAGVVERGAPDARPCRRASDS
jgi:hypothetical protein